MLWLFCGGRRRLRIAMAREFQKISEWRNVTVEMFREEIYPRSRPAVLRGLVNNWPAVKAGRISPQAFCDYVKRFDCGREVGVLTAPADINGRFFYRDDMRGYNFERRKDGLSASLVRLLAQLGDENPPATYVESALVADCVPDFPQENTLDLADPSAVARIWIGNRVRTQTHYDLYDNIACVVAGRRRFTLFGPDQIENLYMGPFEFTLSGTPVSMVSVEEPDFACFPRFEKALDAAQVAELEPGDAIYIPYFWWHHVQSLERFNVLVSHWWNGTPAKFGSLYNCLLHGVLAIRDLPENQRMAWRAMFDHFVFKTSGEPMAHVPPHARGALGPMTQGQQAYMKMVLLDGVQKAVKGQ
jgi:hypothetical protein